MVRERKAKSLCTRCEKPNHNALYCAGPVIKTLDGKSTSKDKSATGVSQASSKAKATRSSSKATVAAGLQAKQSSTSEEVWDNDSMLSDA